MGQRADLALEARAVKQRWPIPGAAIDKLVYRALMFADGRDPDNPEAKPEIGKDGRRVDFEQAARLSLRGLGIIKDMQGQNQTDELMALRMALADIQAATGLGTPDNPIMVQHDHAITLNERAALLVAVLDSEIAQRDDDPAGRASDANGDGPGPLGTGD